MTPKFLRLRTVAILTGVAMLTFSGWVSADPPTRAARLGTMTGTVSFSPAGENDWVRGTLNRPLTTGDRLWSDNGARAEIQVGGAMIRMSAATGVSILNLDNRTTQLQLTQGVLNVRVRRLERNEVFEVDTPNVAFTLRQAGEYRIEVDPDGNATTVIVRSGQGEAWGEGAAYLISTGQAYRFTGTGLRAYQRINAARQDDFDRWSSERDRRYERSVSARYVSADVVGYQDLDANGTWRVDATYGNVWVPSRVAAGWTPYRDGHWSWIDPWGWTWVDDAPWGYAVSHYGRWADLRGTWAWVPGPVRSRAYYAPALVVFIGGGDFQLTLSSGNVGGVAWFPLGPREVYRPSYQVSRGYFENINRSNTVINNTVINNYYNQTNVTQVVYANRQVPGAVIAVPTAAFVQSQPVSRAVVQVSREMVGNRPAAVAPPVVPTPRSVRGAAPEGDKPPARVFERPAVARTAPPAANAGFAAQQPQLAAKPGQPLDDTARGALKRGTAAPVPAINVVVPQNAPLPTLRPPPVAPAAQPVLPVTPAAQAPEPRGRPQAQPPTPDRRTPEPKAAEPKAVEPKVAVPQVAPAPPPPPAVAPRETPRQVPPPPAATQAPQPQRDAPPRAVPAPTAPAAKQAEPQRSRDPVPTPDARPNQPRGPVAAPQSAQPEPVPRAEPSRPTPRRAASQPDDARNDRGERRRDDEDRRQK